MFTLHNTLNKTGIVYYFVKQFEISIGPISPLLMVNYLEQPSKCVVNLMIWFNVYLVDQADGYLEALTNVYLRSGILVQSEQQNARGE